MNAMGGLDTPKLNRRTLLGAPVAVAAAGRVTASSAAAAQTMPSGGGKATFVLVHGAWHGGWCWTKVATLLRAQGHTVLTPTLTGLGERRHLRSRDVTVETHITDIANIFDYDDLGPVILVGHSYGGVIISGVAERVQSRIAKLVYLDAIVLEDGQTPAGEISKERIEQVEASLVEGYLLPKPPPENMGIPPSDPDMQAWLTRHMTEHPWRTFIEPVSLPRKSAQQIPRTYIACTESVVGGRVASSTKAAKGNPDWRYHELATGHDAMVTMPDALAQLLLTEV
jgi:pimeloyl-ACP methyl ester carboxylesterase